MIGWDPKWLFEEHLTQTDFNLGAALLLAVFVLAIILALNSVGAFFGVPT